MTGESLKPYLLSLDDSLASVARKINVSPQHLNQTLSSLDLKTGFVEKIAKAYNVSVGFFFDENTHAETIKAIGKRSVAALKIEKVHTGDTYQSSDSRIKELEAEVSDLQKELLQAQQEIIKLLKIQHQ